MKNIVIVVVVLAFAIIGYRFFQPNHALMPASTNNQTNTSIKTDTTVKPFDDFPDIAPTYVETELSTPQPQQKFRCDGRQHCSQMTSCAEATYFIQHCPNTKMDGNHDGVPCEQQWC